MNYLSASLTSLEGEYPGCGFVLCGDFNRLNTHRLTTQFKLKQLVDKPTRGDQILDLVLTNLPQLYDSNAVQTFPPFGMSDHNVVLVRPKARPKGNGCSMRTTARRDTRPSRKLELGRYLSSIDWSPVNGDDCEARLSMFVDIIQIGMDHIMPVKHFKTHVNDAPWITAEFKNLIKLASKRSTREIRTPSAATATSSTASGNLFAASTLLAKLTISSPPSPLSGGTLSNGLQEWSPAPDQSLFFPAYIWMAI